MKCWEKSLWEDVLGIDKRLEKKNEDGEECKEKKKSIRMSIW